MREDDDPHCLTESAVDGLLSGAPWKRFVVIGDSVAAGVHEPVDGYRSQGWADRVADGLRRTRPDLVYENLAERGLRARQVREAQLDRALALEPDLAAVICGGNDLFVEHFNPGKVERELDRIVAALSDAGAEVITFTLYDITQALLLEPEFSGPFRERLAELAERTGRVAERRGTLHVTSTSTPPAPIPASTRPTSSMRMRAATRSPPRA